MPTSGRIPTYSLGNELDDIEELIDPLSSFSIPPSGPASPEHVESGLPVDQINMDPLNDIGHEEFIENEEDNEFTNKKGKIVRNEKGGIIITDCRVDIQTLNNNAAGLNMSELGFYLQSILKELKECQRLLVKNSSLEERLSNVEQSLSRITQNEGKK